MTHKGSCHPDFCAGLQCKRFVNQLCSNKQHDKLTSYRVTSVRVTEAVVQRHAASSWHGRGSSRLEVVKVVFVCTDQAPRRRWITHVSWRTRSWNASGRNARSWYAVARLWRHVRRRTVWTCWTMRRTGWMDICRTDGRNRQVTCKQWIGKWRETVLALIWCGWRTGWWYRVMIILTQVWHWCLRTSWQNSQAAVVHVVLQTHQVLTSE